jgi:hypothetical protein
MCEYDSSKVQINEGTNTIHYTSTSLVDLLRLAANDVEGKSITYATMHVDTNTRNVETGEHPYELIVTDID